MDEGLREVFTKFGALGAGALALMGVSDSRAATSYNFSTLNPPGATAGELLAVFGVNDNDQALVGGNLAGAEVINDLYLSLIHI